MFIFLLFSAVNRFRFMQESIVLPMRSCIYFYFSSQVIIKQIVTNTTDSKDLLLTIIFLTNISDHPLHLHFCEKGFFLTANFFALSAALIAIRN